jgi:hypothetical protein
MSVRSGQQILMVVAKFRERLAVSKQTTHRVHMERVQSQEIK